MAGLNELENDGALVGGLLGGLARRQYSAMLELRWRLMVNSLRTSQGVVEFWAKVLALLVYASICLGISTGFGIGAYAIVSSGSVKYLPLLYWANFVLWIWFAILLSSLQTRFDLTLLLRFPVSFGSYSILSLLFGLSDPSTLIGAMSLVGIWVGVSFACPRATFFVADLNVLAAIFNLLLVRAAFTWVDRWLAKRKTREIFTAITLLSVLCFQLLNPGLNPGAAAGIRKIISPEWIHRLALLQMWLPTGAIGHAVRLLAGEQPSALHQVNRVAEALPWALLMFCYAFVVGGVLLYRLREEYKGENFSEGEARKVNEVMAKSSPRERSALELRTEKTDGKRRAILAVMEKEWRLLLRSTPILYSLGAPLFYCVLLAGVWFKNGGHGSRLGFAYALPIMIAFAMLSFANYFSNLMGTEGAGIQLYYLSPTPLRLVLLGKNFFYSLLMLLDCIVISLLVTMRVGPPSRDAVMITVCWVLFALFSYLVVGNRLSIWMPYRVNLNRIGKRGSGSQANSLLSVLAQMVVNGIGAAVIGIALLAGHLWYAAPAFLALACGMFFVWWYELGNVERLAYAQSEKMIGKLAKVE